MKTATETFYKNAARVKLVSPLIDITGKRYGRLLVLEHMGKLDGDHWWKCLCDCGSVTIKAKRHIGRESNSCGCLAREVGKRVFVHGLHKSSEYRIWAGMKQRCRNSTTRDFCNYGGRGIVVCERWEKFENFYSDMGPRPSNDHSIERINNSGNYEPSNCKWATVIEQHSNTRVNRKIQFNGKNKTISEWSRELGIVRATLDHRLKSGWPIIAVMTKPVRKRI